MRKYLLSYIFIVFMMNLLVSYGFTQEYFKWRLPDGAKARLGKGSIKIHIVATWVYILMKMT